MYLESAIDLGKNRQGPSRGGHREPPLKDKGIAQSAVRGQCSVYSGLLIQPVPIPWLQRGVRIGNFIDGVIRIGKYQGLW